MGYGTFVRLDYPLVSIIKNLKEKFINKKLNNHYISRKIKS